MVGHLLEYHPGVQKLKEIVDSGELGDVHYIYSNRLNLGKLRADENALWSLGAHDVSVVLHLAGEEPYEVAAHGESYVRPGVEDVVFCFMRFPSGLSAHMHLSWLDPHKERRFTVVGSKRMATFDDMDFERKVTGVRQGVRRQGAQLGRVRHTVGDIYSPAIGSSERLRLECGPLRGCVRRARHRAPTARAGCAWSRSWKASRRPSTAQGAWLPRSSRSPWRVADERNRPASATTTRPTTCPGLPATIEPCGTSRST